MNKKHILICLALVIAAIAYLFSQLGYNRIDVIDESPRFFIYRIFNQNIIERENIPEGAMPSPPGLIDVIQKKEYHPARYDNIYIKESLKEISVDCQQRSNFIIGLGNKGEEPILDVAFSVSDNKNLIFDFPENFVIPPNSIKEATVEVTADCKEFYSPRITPVIAIANRLSLNLVVNVREKFE